MQRIVTVLFVMTYYVLSVNFMSAHPLTQSLYSLCIRRQTIRPAQQHTNVIAGVEHFPHTPPDIPLGKNKLTLLLSLCVTLK